MSSGRKTRRILYALGALTLAAPLFPGATASTPAAAQAGMQSVPLTPAKVEGLIASFPQIKAAADGLRTRYGAPDGGNQPANAFGAFLAYQGAVGELNAVVTPYGFTSFTDWIQVLVSAATALAFSETGGVDAQMAEAIAAIRANTAIPAAQKDMMIQMLQSQAGALGGLRPPPENLAAIQPYAARLRAAFGN